MTDRTPNQARVMALRDLTSSELAEFKRGAVEAERWKDAARASGEEKRRAARGVR